MRQVIYVSGVHSTLGWDVMQVRSWEEDPITKTKFDFNSFVVARDSNGDILRKTDIVYDRWEVITDEADRRGFQSLFEDRDRRLAAGEGVVPMWEMNAEGV